LIDGLCDVRLEVTDLERSVAFYRDGLRFTFEGSEDGDPPRAYLRAGDLHLVLARVPQRGVARRGGGLSLSVEVTGVDAYHDALVARGLSPCPPADDDRHRRFTIQDPDGYRWAFVQSLG
jgi:catechol 2,3-dioxygenase-like lactoylglutathione lyase family enzyme